MNRTTWVVAVPVVILLLVNFGASRVVKGGLEEESARLQAVVESGEPDQFPVELQREIRRAIEIEEASFLTEEELSGEEYLSVVSSVRRVAIDSGLNVAEFQVSLPEEGDNGRVSLISSGSVEDVLKFVATRERLAGELTPTRIELRRGRQLLSLRVELRPNLLSELGTLPVEVVSGEMEASISSVATTAVRRAPDVLAGRLFSRYPPRLNSFAPDITRFGAVGGQGRIPDWIGFSGVELDSRGRRHYFFVDGRSGRIRRLGVGDSEGGWSLHLGDNGITLTVDGEEYQIMEGVQ